MNPQPMPPDVEVFNNTVWKIVRQVPLGVVTTFGQIASMIRVPPGVEEEDYDRYGPIWVGKAMNAISGPEETSIPWQRVINSQGGISLPDGSRSAIEQRLRLQREGVAFGKNGRVSLQTYGWEGPDEEWLRSNNFLKPRPLKKPGEEASGQLKLF